MGVRADVGARAVQGVRLPDRYKVIRRIATGGMASVWCAEDRLLGRRVAIKVLSETLAADETAVRRFKREARTAGRLSGHPHIVTIYDVGETSDATSERRAFIVMEYLAGGTVADALRVGAVTREEAVRWLTETAGALDYAHAHGVIHRDIKPANLLLDRDRVLHVADFGIARLGTDDTITRAGQLLGTAGYLAPERALGHEATEASDRYSLAVAAFELLTGERPFTAEAWAAQARAHVEEQPPRASDRNPELPRSVDAVLIRGMAKDPSERWPSSGEFAVALEAALAERPRRHSRGALALAPIPAEAATAPAAAATRRSAPPPRTIAQGNARRRAVAIAALAAAVLCVGLLATLGRGHKSKVSSTNVARHPATTASKPAKHRAAPPAAKTHTTATSASSSSTSTTSAAAPPTTADGLEARGHALMVAGRYQDAIPVLRQALAAASPSTLTYAYALFDLGRSLRLAGDPRAAVPVLYRRLQIPDQTGVVRLELQLALQELGQQARQGGGTRPAPAPAGPPGHAKHGGHDKSPGHAGDQGD